MKVALRALCGTSAVRYRKASIYAEPSQSGPWGSPRARCNAGLLVERPVLGCTHHLRPHNAEQSQRYNANARPACMPMPRIFGSSNRGVSPRGRTARARIACCLARRRDDAQNVVAINAITKDALAIDRPAKGPPTRSDNQL